MTRESEAITARKLGRELAEDLDAFLQGWREHEGPAPNGPGEVPLFDDETGIRVFLAMVAGQSWTPEDPDGPPPARDL